MRTAPVRLGIVDDHPVYRAGLATILQQSSNDVMVRWTAARVEDALDLMATEPVDGILLDYHLEGGESGVAALLAITARRPGLAVVVMSGFAGPSEADDVRRAGAAAYVHKSMPLPEMVDTILRAVGAVSAALEFARVGAAEERLSARERDVLALIRKGMTNREISGQLGISVTTVNKHVHNLLVRMGARNRSEAAQRPSGWDRASATP